jgi:DNA-binding MarR family transcriptional regulator
MEAAGLIERSPVPHDRRAWELTLTRRGYEVLDKAMTAHVPGIERHLTGPLDAEQIDELEQILRRLRTAAMPRQRQR